jgi:hypothetical protein
MPAQTAVARARADDNTGAELAYVGALTFWSYMMEYWIPMTEDWCHGGRERAAQAVAGMRCAEEFPNTNNHLESYNNVFKASLKRYAVV